MLPRGREEPISDRSSASRPQIQEVVPGIFRIVVPLPIPDVQTMNSYVITDNERSLIVDPGMSHPACREALAGAIGELGLDLGRTDFFITHHHLDHFGSVLRFLSETSRIYISRAEAEFISKIASGKVETDMGIFLEMLGFPDRDPTRIVSQFYGDEYRPQRSWPFRYVAEGDILARGSRNFSCLITPGHSIGHSCLYEAEDGILISGDQITAGVQFLRDRANPLSDHLESLKRLRSLNATRTLPGHGSPFSDHRQRIDRLHAHHQGRLDAVCSVLGEAGRDAYQVTIALEGLLPDREPFDTMPYVLRFIHTRHTFAYLQYLVAAGSARQENSSGRILFFRCQSVR